jgi:hypothetical protein
VLDIERPDAEKEVRAEPLGTPEDALHVDARAELLL